MATFLALIGYAAFFATVAGLCAMSGWRKRRNETPEEKRIRLLINDLARRAQH